MREEETSTEQAIFNGQVKQRSVAWRNLVSPIFSSFGETILAYGISAILVGHDGLRTPNIDRIAGEGATFTDFYGQQSCTAGRACFITGQNPIRTGLTKVGMPGATVGLHAEDPPSRKC